VSWMVLKDLLMDSSSHYFQQLIIVVIYLFIYVTRIQLSESRIPLTVGGLV
jgi:hypothetical protein